MVEYSYYNNPWRMNNYRTSVNYSSNPSQWNYVATTPTVPMSYAMPSSVWSPYAYSYPTTGLASGTSTTNNEKFESVEDYEKRIYESTLAHQRQLQDEKQNGTITIGENGELKLDKITSAKAKEEELKNLENTNKAARTNLGMSLAGGSLFMGGTIINGLKVKTNLPVTQGFFAEVGGKAKYAQLYKDAPTVMLEAQEELAKVHRDYLKQLKRYKENGSATTELKKAYKNIKKQFVKAMNSGNADDVAKLTHQLKDTKGFWQRFKIWGKAPRIEDRLAKMAAVDASQITARTGNSFLQNCGGKMGLKIGIAMGGLSLIADIGKIRTAFKDHGFGAGMKQLGQSTVTALVPATVYTLSDGLGRTLVNKAVSKGAGKIAVNMAKKGLTKIGSKLAGRAAGAVIGSAIPGLGTVLGFAIGCVADWAIQKWIMPHSDTMDKKNIEAKTDEELIKNARIRQLQGEKIDPRMEKLLASNPELCKQLDQVIMQGQQAA